jgi:hypothetical protein
MSSILTPYHFEIAEQNTDNRERLLSSIWMASIGVCRFGSLGYFVTRQAYEHINTIESETVRKTYHAWNFLMKRRLIAILLDCRIKAFHHCQGWKIVEFAILPFGWQLLARYPRWRVGVSTCLFGVFCWSRKCAVTAILANPFTRSNRLLFYRSTCICTMMQR